MSELDRREFLTALATLPIAAQRPAQPIIKVGYAAITWGGNDDVAIREVAETGFRGIQLRATAFDAYRSRPAALREVLAKHKLTFAVLSSGNLKIDPALEREQIDLHLSHAAFVRDAGGIMLQVIDEKPRGRAPGPDDFKRLGNLMSELGRRTAAIGVPLVYHHHMNSIGEAPAAIDAIVAASDLQYVGLLFDIAHYQQGGGDPAAGIRRFGKVIKVVHLKDVRHTETSPGYQWVELGRGRVDVKECMVALKNVGFGGWAIVELDRVVDPGGSPKASAAANRDYVVNELRLVL